MTGAAIAAGSAALAACTGNAPASNPPPTQAAASLTPASAAPTPVPSYKLESELFLFNWSDYFSPDNKKAFTAKYHLSNFHEDTYPSNEDMLAKLQAGGKGQYDITVPTAEFSATLA